MHRLPLTPRHLLLPLAVATVLLAGSTARAGYEWQGSLASLISTVVNQASRTVGSANQVPPVKVSWCEGTYYSPDKHTICFNRPFMESLARKMGDGAVAYVAAHEYAHHLQTSSPKMMRRAKGNTLRLELQADCYAGIILAGIPKLRFDDRDIQEMLATASLLGDHNYDSNDHHGAGENRALALRAGLRQGSTGEKDNYYGLFCRMK